MPQQKHLEKGTGMGTRSLCKNQQVPWALATVLVFPILDQLLHWALSSPKEFYSNPNLATIPRGAGGRTLHGGMVVSNCWRHQGSGYRHLCTFTLLTFLLWTGFDETVRGGWVQVQLCMSHPPPLTKDPTCGSSSLLPITHRSTDVWGGGSGQKQATRFKPAVHLANTELVPGS